MYKGSRGVEGAESCKRAKLVGVKKADRPGQEGEACSNDSFKDLRDGLKENNNAKGCRGGVVSFTGFRENNAISPLER